MTDTSKEAIERCEAGCVAYHGGERRHHRDCVFYPESMTKMLDDCEAERDTLKAEIKRRHNAQSYTYIGKDGKSVQARDLEDERDQALAQFYECQNMLNAAKAEIERLRGVLLACDDTFRRLGYTSNSVAREDISNALEGSSQ